MPVMESDNSRSGSSSNESDNEDAQSHSRSQTPRSRSQSPGTEPQSPDSNRSRSRSHSNTPKSPSLSPERSILNGPQSPEKADSLSPVIQRSRSNSALSYGRSPERSNHSSQPLTPKSTLSHGSVSPPPTPNSSRTSPRGLQSPVSSGDNSLSPSVPRNLQKVHPKSRGSDSEDDASRNLRGRSSSRSTSRGSRNRSKSGSASDSSIGSVDSSARKNKDVTRATDTRPEDISDGDMESDHGSSRNKVEKGKVTITHEDLSDVSDLEDSIGGHSENERPIEPKKHNEPKTEEKNDHREDLEDKSRNVEKKVPFVDGSLTNARPDEGEEQLDFEAEDGECEEVKSKDDEKEEGEEDKEDHQAIVKEEKELEEGEVTDEDDARPEETEPRPICRFFSRGACTWGASCRFLHPGVTDKGNYTMFDMVRPMLPGEYGMGRMGDDRHYKPEPPHVESAWERGLRTAKEMLKKSMRRKEQDIDFEEKKMNLSIAQEEFDKENGYYGRIPSPEPRYVRHIPEYVARPPPEEYYGRRPIMYENEYMPPRREHPRPYREMPPPRGPPPDYYNPKYEEEPPPRSLERPEARDRERDRERRKPKREVIVQRTENKDERPTRGDEWQDPWMRSKSPSRRKDRKRSYSSGSSSYSSSSSRSSSASSKSSYRSRSAYRRDRSRSKQPGARQVSPSVIVSERKAANERAALMNPPAPRRRAPSPGMMRVTGAANPPAPSSREDYGRTRSKLAVAAALARVKNRRHSSRSSSGSSSGSSSSDSDSSESSSSSNRSNSPPTRDVRKTSEFVKAIALKSAPPEKNKIKINLKNPSGPRKPDAAKVEVTTKKRPASSPPPGDPKSKKATSRREELLKQLKAVEDAIAKKRSKV
ncbi:zinc finger CCCH domain-containing protein 18 isoform X1 [Euwallacea similis]|uniref:zinc finger CCCH domain-containing protein 18 isoform X1 n=1 Tax=Euwallacea similis TaxID=1736056 RepID=UPI00344C2A09